MVMGRDVGFLVDLAGGDVEAFAARHRLDLVAIVACPLHDLIADAYLIKVAGPLSVGWIAADRLALFRALAVEFGDESADPRPGPRGFLQRFLSVLKVSLDRVDVGDSAILPAAAGLSRVLPPRYPTAD